MVDFTRQIVALGAAIYIIFFNNKNLMLFLFSIPTSIL